MIQYSLSYVKHKNLYNLYISQTLYLFFGRIYNIHFTKGLYITSLLCYNAKAFVYYTPSKQTKGNTSIFNQGGT